jgi:hypothetical protein
VTCNLIWKASKTSKTRKTRKTCKTRKTSNLIWKALNKSSIKLIVGCLETQEPRTKLSGTQIQ